VVQGRYQKKLLAEKARMEAKAKEANA